MVWFLITNTVLLLLKKADLVPEQLLALSHYDNEDVQLEFVRNSENTSEVTLSLEGVSCCLCMAH
ncbi:hypothetical protein O9853_06875 [Vibrio lentus]|nr:hypothetical protein [Vibrio lentus]